MRFGIVLSLLCMFAMTSCAYKYDTLKTTRIKGSSFNAHLAREYKKLAVFEAYDMHDYDDADFYSQKSFAAMNGEHVAPSLPDSRRIHINDERRIKQAYKTLNFALEFYNTEENHAMVAKAQAKFDCWLEQLEENRQPSHIASCKNGFWSAIRAIKMPQKTITETLVVYFDFDSAVVEPTGMQSIRYAVSLLEKGSNLHVLLSGYTDRSGPESYNKTLSEDRAKAVAEKLAAMGVAKDRVITLGKGEQELYKPTPDGVREPQNRRVTIFIAKDIVM